MKTEKSLKPKDNELDLINTLSPSPLSDEEVEVFSLTLCDNEIDRDFEHFTVNALEKLSKLFVGVSGIFDHSVKAKDQCARIISCRTEKTGAKTSYGDDYVRLVARAYTLNTDENRQLIKEIEGGIKKEISVNCAVAKKTCSVCGMPYGSCEHRKGRTYGSTLCSAILDEPTDAYEWSFVAVPAQRAAGVTKSFKKEKTEVRDIIKTLKDCAAITSGEAEYLQTAIEFAEKILLLERSKAAAAIKSADCMLSSEIVDSLVSRLTPEELYKMRRGTEKCTDKSSLQLKTQKSRKEQKNKSFII